MTEGRVKYRKSLPGYMAHRHSQRTDTWECSGLWFGTGKVLGPNVNVHAVLNDILLQYEKMMKLIAKTAACLTAGRIQVSQKYWAIQKLFPLWYLEKHTIPRSTIVKKKKCWKRISRGIHSDRWKQGSHSAPYNLSINIQHKHQGWFYLKIFSW